MPNDDYILRSDALEHFGNYLPGCSLQKDDVIRGIEELPAADVEPVRHGRLEYDSDHIPHCSECETIALQRHKLYLEEKIYDVPFVLSKRCPECGAKMDDEPPKEETVNEITTEMIEAAERNEKRIKERVGRIYDEMIAEKRAEIERLEAEIAKMPPFDAEKLAAIPLVPPKEFIV